MTWYLNKKFNDKTYRPPLIAGWSPPYPRSDGAFQHRIVTQVSVFHDIYLTTWWRLFYIIFESFLCYLLIICVIWFYDYLSMYLLCFFNFLCVILCEFCMILLICRSIVIGFQEKCHIRLVLCFPIVFSIFQVSISFFLRLSVMISIWNFTS